MELINGIESLSEDIKVPYLAIGNYDGVHAGHQSILKKMVKKAKSKGEKAGLLTFEPHPTKITVPDLAPSIITPLGKKIELLTAFDLDYLIIQPFNMEFAAISPASFIEEKLVSRLGVKRLYVGYDFTFGHMRSGSIEVLQSYQSEDFQVQVEAPVKVNSLLVSSTKIRAFLMEGHVYGAQLLLQRPFSISGHVAVGVGRGRQLGFPTANIDTINELVPRPGVYACRLKLPEGMFNGVVNVGYRPTFGDTEDKLIEVFLFDFKEDIYLRQVELFFYKRIRAERKFATVDALIEAIKVDEKMAREILA